MAEGTSVATAGSGAAPMILRLSAAGLLGDAGAGDATAVAAMFVAAGTALLAAGAGALRMGPMGAATAALLTTDVPLTAFSLPFVIMSGVTAEVEPCQCACTANVAQPAAVVLTSFVLLRPKAEETPSCLFLFNFCWCHRSKVVSE